MENRSIPFSITQKRFSFNEEITNLIKKEIDSNEDYFLTPDDLIEVGDDKVVFVSRTIPIFTDSLLKKFDPKKNKLDKKYTDDFWFVGRDKITEFCSKKFGFSSWHTARAWRDNYAFPIRNLPNGEPFLIYIEAINWALMYDNIIKEIKRDKRERFMKAVMKKYDRTC